jgi:hypothetical protein
MPCLVQIGLYILELEVNIFTYIQTYIHPICFIYSEKNHLAKLVLDCKAECIVLNFHLFFLALYLKAISYNLV